MDRTLTLLMNIDIADDGRPRYCFFLSKTFKDSNVCIEPNPTCASRRGHQTRFHSGSGDHSKNVILFFLKYGILDDMMNMMQN